MVTPAESFTEAEYLALEAVAETKHEFVNGVIVSMAGAKPMHNALAANLTAVVNGLLRGSACIALTSDQRVHVPATGLYAYPDLTVACGERKYKDDKPPSLLNPTILFEVTSKSTEDYDRGTKFLHYQGIESLREYVVVSHREKRIEHHRRLESGQWLETIYSAEGDKIELPVLAGSFTLGDVYDRVDLSEGE
jgi:Uma2 family endonuclease